MKFKTITRTELGVLVYKYKLIECPIDGKNLSLDIFDDIFENADYTKSPANNDMVGFIHNTPVHIRYRNNFIGIHPVFGIDYTSEDAVTGRFSRLFNNDHDKDNENEIVMLCTQDYKNFFVYCYWAKQGQIK